MKKNIALIIIAGLCLTISGFADVIIWEEDFSELESDWIVSYDPAGNSTVSNVAGFGVFYVEGADTEASFIPDSAQNDYVAFDPATADDYTFNMVVESVDPNAYYDVAVDLFDASYTWLDTVWGVVGASTDATEHNVNLGSFSYDANTAYLMPKVNAHTTSGVGSQYVYVDSMDFVAAIPEPTSMALLFVGIGATYLVRRKRQQ